MTERILHEDDDDVDWCPREEKLTIYDGEVCTSCGYEWGSGAE